MAIDWDETVLQPVIGLFGEASGPVRRPIPVYTSTEHGITFPIDGVFDEAYRGIAAEAGMPEADAHPLFSIRAAALPVGLRPEQEDTIVLFSSQYGQTRRYVVNNVRPDGHGSIHLDLNFLEIVSQ